MWVRDSDSRPTVTVTVLGDPHWRHPQEAANQEEVIQAPGVGLRTAVREARCLRYTPVQGVGAGAWVVVQAVSGQGVMGRGGGQGVGTSQKGQGAGARAGAGAGAGARAGAGAEGALVLQQTEVPLSPFWPRARRPPAVRPSSPRG